MWLGVGDQKVRFFARPMALLGTLRSDKIKIADHDKSKTVIISVEIRNNFRLKPETHQNSV